MTQTDLDQLVAALSTPFYFDAAFWIGLVVGVVGIVLSGFGVLYSLRAFREAREAKLAAREAGRTVKRLTVVVDLTEIALRLERIDSNIDFGEARQLLNDASRRIHRLLAPYRAHSDYDQHCSQLYQALANARVSLETMYPESSDEGRAGTTIFFATEKHFALISNHIATILGLFEQESIEGPDERLT